MHSIQKPSVVIGRANRQEDAMPYVRAAELRRRSFQIPIDFWLPSGCHARDGCMRFQAALAILTVPDFVVYLAATDTGNHAGAIGKLHPQRPAS